MLTSLKSRPSKLIVSVFRERIKGSRRNFLFSFVVSGTVVTCSKYGVTIMNESAVREVARGLKLLRHIVFYHLDKLMQ